MAGDVKSQQLFFVREQFVLRPFGQVADGFRHRRRFFLQRAEERTLSALAIGGDACGAAQSAFDLGAKRGARLPKTVASAGFDERFKNFAVHRASVHALAQIRKRSEFSAFVSRLENGFHRDFAHTFDRSETEANASQRAAGILPAGLTFFAVVVWECYLNCRRDAGSMLTRRGEM